MKTLIKSDDWYNMKIGERAKFNDEDNNIIITCVPFGWIYSEYLYCEKLDTYLTTNTFIQRHA